MSTAAYWVDAGERSRPPPLKITHPRPPSSFRAGNKAGAARADLKAGSLANGSDVQADGIAAIHVHWPLRVAAAFNELSA
jgi:hypothetical protein